MVAERGGGIITKYALYRAVLTMMVILIVLTVLCLFWVEPGESAYYVCLLTLAADVPVLTFIIIKLVISYRKNERIDTKTYQLPVREKKIKAPREK